MEKNSDDNRIPNLKEFIRYLEQTVKLFENHVDEEDFENKDSEVYKLFVTLFNLYTESDKKSSSESPYDLIKEKPHVVPKEKSYAMTNESPPTKAREEKFYPKKIDKPKMDNIIKKHFENSKLMDSDKRSYEIYQRALRDLETVDDDEPILVNKPKIVEKAPPKRKTSFQNVIEQKECLVKKLAQMDSPACQPRNSKNAKNAISGYEQKLMLLKNINEREKTKRPSNSNKIYIMHHSETIEKESEESDKETTVRVHDPTNFRKNRKEPKKVAFPIERADDIYTDHDEINPPKPIKKSRPKETKRLETEYIHQKINDLKRFLKQ